MKNLIYFNIYIIVSTFISAFIIFLSRIGFYQNIFFYLEIIFLTFYFLLLPFVLNYYKISFRNFPLYKFSMSVTVANFIIILTFNFLFQNFFTNLSTFLSLIGCIFFIIFIFNFYKYIDFNYKYLIINLIIFVILGCFFTSAYYINSYLHPLYFEKLATGSWAHRDGLWQSSMAGIHKTYGEFSPGIDGIISYNYHFFSHFIYSSFGQIFNKSTIIIYTIVAPIFFVQIFLFFCLNAISSLSRYFNFKYNLTIINAENSFFWLIFLILFAMPLPLNIMPEKYTYLTSPSYFFAITITFICVCLVNEIILGKYLFKKKIYIYLFFLITVPFFYVIISFSKISFSLLFISIFLFIFLRKNLYKIFIFNLLTFFLIILSFYLYYSLITSFLDRPGKDFLTSYNTIFKELFFNIIFFLFFIFIKIYIIFKKDYGKIFNFFLKGRYFDLEIIFLLIFLFSFIPYDYFRGIPIYITIILILSHLESFNYLFFKKND